MKNADIEKYICCCHLYSRGLIPSALKAQISYLTKFLEPDEEVQTAAFCHLKYANVEASYGTLVLFTDKRLIYGYKYMFGIVKLFGEIPYAQIVCSNAQKAEAVSLKTKNGMFTFTTLQTDEVDSGENGHVCIQPYYMALKIETLVFRDLLKNASITAEQKQQAEALIEDATAELAHYNDLNKGFQYGMNVIHDISEDDFDKYIRLGWREGVLVDHPECADMNVAHFMEL